MVTRAARKGAGLVVLPELCTTGLDIGQLSNFPSLPETVPGPTTTSFAALSRKYRIYIVFGLTEYEPATGKRYNSQVITGPDGELVGTYRKMHLYGPDLTWAQTGDLGYCAFDTSLGRVGLGICCDINYWELMEFLVINEVDIFAFSTNWVGDELPFQYWRDMTAAGSYFLIAANNWGEEGDIRFTGGSAILSPEKDELAKTITSSR